MRKLIPVLALLITLIGGAPAYALSPYQPLEPVDPDSPAPHGPQDPPEEEDTDIQPAPVVIEAEAAADISVSQDDAAEASIDAASAELAPEGVLTSEDLSLYATAMMKRDSNVEHIDTSADTVSVTYRKDARFLALFPTTIKATAEVKSDGSVDIDYPWYRFLFAVGDTSEMETALETGATQVLAGGAFTAQTEASLINLIHTTFSGDAGITTEPVTTADQAGPLTEEPTGDAAVDVYPQ